MAVVGADEFYAIFLGETDKRLISFLLQRERLPVGNEIRVLHLMTLELKIIIIAKQVMIPLTCLTRTVDVAFQDLRRHLTGNTRREHNQSLVVLLQFGTVGTGFIVVALHPCMADEFDKIFVTLIVLCQYNKVVAAVVAVLLNLIEHAVMGNVHLAAIDGLERLKSLFLPVLINLSAIIGKLLYAEHHTMVGDSHTPHAILDSLVDKMSNLRLSVKNRIMSVTMQMYEIFHNSIQLEC